MVANREIETNLQGLQLSKTVESLAFDYGEVVIVQIPVHVKSIGSAKESSGIAHIQLSQIWKN